MLKSGKLPPFDSEMSKSIDAWDSMALKSVLRLPAAAPSSIFMN